MEGSDRRSEIAIEERQLRRILGRDRPRTDSIHANVIDELEMSVRDMEEELQLLDGREPSDENPGRRADLEGSIRAGKGEGEVLHGR
jgi:hypothetical protein